MQYMGGKTRQGKHIEEQLLRYKGDCTIYIEPFMGGGSIFARMAPHFPGAALGADVHPDLMMMWEALRDGWEPPTEVTREDWYRIKDEEPSALRGFVGFGCSFGGRWFEGYASNGRGDDFCCTARKGVLKKSASMRDARLLTAPYTALEPGPGVLVYCDPPYASTKPYSGTDAFDTMEFWTTVRRWADNGATVLVSEYTAPEWAEEVWSRNATVSLKSDSNDAKAVERLFLVRPVSDPATTVAETTTRGDDVSGKGPWFSARFDGICSGCGGATYEGDTIRADGQGGYECEDCELPDVDSVRLQPPGHDWQAQASAAAKRHVASQGEDPAPVSRGMANLTDTAQYAAQYVTTADTFEDPSPRAEPKPVFNVSGQPPAERDWMGRYLVVDPELGDFRRAKNGNALGITRTTTFVKAASDNKAINDWGKRNVVIGASRRRDLILKAVGLTHEDDRDRLDGLVRELESAAGAKVGSDLGTFLHEFTEFMDAGIKTWLDAPEEFRESLKKYARALDDAGLEPVPGLIERTVMIREFGGVCGTFDRVFFHRPSGTYVIGDLKTGKTLRYGVDEFCAQLWNYAHGVNQHGVYDWNTNTWRPLAHDAGVPNTMPPLLSVREDVGVIIHMPVQGPEEGTVSLVWADLEAGAAHAELCHKIRSRPKIKVRPWGNGPAPVHAPTAAPQPAPAIDRILIGDERPWPERFSSVETSEQASALWRMARARGVDGLELQTLVGLAQQRLKELGVTG